MLGYTLGNNNNNNGSGSAGPLMQRRDDRALSHRDPALDHATGAGAVGAGGGGYTVVGDNGSSGSSPLDARLNMDIPSLEYLLQSVRDIDDD